MPPTENKSKTKIEEGTFQFVKTEWNGDVAVVRINRPHQANALNPATLFDLQRTLVPLMENSSVKGIVLSSVEPGFVQGADIDFLIRCIAQNEFERLHYYTKLGNDCFDLISQSPKPIVGVVNGPAIGGGFELTLACPIRYAVPNASFALPETSLGICPIWGAVPRLKKRIIPELAKWLAASGKNLSAQDAFDLNLIDGVFSAEQIFDVASDAVKGKRVDTQIGSRKPLNLGLVIDYFKQNSIEAIHAAPLPSWEDKTLIASIRSLKRNSRFALKYLEQIFETDVESPLLRDSFYRKLVEELYRSEDTNIGLTWRRQKKIGSPPFPSNRSS